jgi:hypothetical protein
VILTFSLLRTKRSALALVVLKLVNQHRSSNAITRQRSAQLLATVATGAMAQEREEPEQNSQEALNTLVTRLLVELAVQHR